jgi:hypothetical protein
MKTFSPRTEKSVDEDDAFRDGMKTGDDTRTEAFPQRMMRSIRQAFSYKPIETETDEHYRSIPIDLEGGGSVVNDSIIAGDSMSERNAPAD